MIIPWSPRSERQPEPTQVYRCRQVGAPTTRSGHWRRSFDPLAANRWLLLFALLTLMELVIAPRLQPAPPLASVWQEKPLLEYFLLTQSLAQEMQAAGALNPRQMALGRWIARLEADQLARLKAESLPIVLNPRLSLEQKRSAIAAMGYNRRALEIAASSRQLLALLLERRSYQRFTAWVGERWEVERRRHGMAAFPVEPAGFAPSPDLAPRTYEIFATRYDAGDNYTVALPDMCLKFSNAGNRLCADKGYQINQGYSVFLRYKKSTAAEVWESGPWNVDDNYWSSLNDPQPRRMFADLPTGMPEAQAAYFDGYNGGLDQFGRVVTAPFGIDLARQVSIDIGLQPGNNDWITVSFTWTDGWGKGSQPKAEPAQATATAAPTIAPLLTSTPNPDGSLVHEVQPGQAPWSIAIAYGITLEELYQLNRLSAGAIIRPGDKLLIRPAPPSPTVTLTPEPSPTLPPTLTRAPATPTARPSATVAASPTPPDEPEAQSSAVDPFLLIIGGVFALGVLLLLFGTAFRRRS